MKLKYFYLFAILICLQIEVAFQYFNFPLGIDPDDFSEESWKSRDDFYQRKVLFVERSSGKVHNVHQEKRIISWNTSNYFGPFNQTQTFVFSESYDEAMPILRLSGTFTLLLINPILNTQLLPEDIQFQVWLPFFSYDNDQNEQIDANIRISQKIPNIRKDGKSRRDTQMGDQYIVLFSYSVKKINLRFFYIYVNVKNKAESWALNQFKQSIVLVPFQCSKGDEDLCTECPENSILKDGKCDCASGFMIGNYYSRQVDGNDLCVQIDPDDEIIEKYQFESLSVQAAQELLINTIFIYELVTNYHQNDVLDSFTLRLNLEYQGREKINTLWSLGFMEIAPVLLVNNVSYYSDEDQVDYLEQKYGKEFPYKKLYGAQLNQTTEKAKMNQFTNRKNVSIVADQTGQQLQITIPFEILKNITPQIVDQNGIIEKTYLVELKFFLYDQSQNSHYKAAAQLVNDRSTTFNLIGIENTLEGTPEQYFLMRPHDNVHSIQVQLNGFYSGQIEAQSFICENEFCRYPQRDSSLELMQMNYLKVYITDPEVDGVLSIDEIKYKSNHSPQERFLVIDRVYQTNQRKSEVILGFSLKSLVLPEDMITITISATFANESTKLRNLAAQITKLPQITQQNIQIKNSPIIIDDVVYV